MSRRSARALAEFRERLESEGATLLETAWLGSMKPHRAVCAKGHHCSPAPNTLQQKKSGICPTCTGRAPGMAEAKFRASLAAQGATLTEPWRGAGKPHRVRCAEGHEYPRHTADVNRGARCNWCFGNSSAGAESGFLARLAEMGATPSYDEWLGHGKPHKVICRAGHECFPSPTNVQRGQGICTKCAGKDWDVFYVMARPDGDIKFGITSGDPRARIAHHRRAGYSEVVRLFTGLPEGWAKKTEDQCKSALREAHIDPAWGREYFPAEALAVVLDVADGWLATM